MSKAMTFLKKELLELIPPTVFFFLVFEIVVWARALMGGETAEYSLTSTAAAAIGALIVGKSILIIDLLPLFTWLRDKPLIVDALWRLLLYMVLILTFQFLEELIPLWSKYGSASAGFSHFMEEVHWPRFLATHALLSVFLGIYCVMSSLVRLVGHDRALQAFFRGSNPPPV